MPKKSTKKTESVLQQPAAQPSVNRPSTGKVISPSSEQIAKRAYELYLARGKKPGHHHDDWIQAERELKSSGLGAN